MSTELNEIPEGWEETTLGNLAKIKYGKDHKKLDDGSIPCYGSGGVMRHVSKALYDKESILIPRKGTLSNLFYVNEPFWTVDTLFYTKMDNDRIFPKYLFYKLKSKNLEDLNVGSAVPSLTTAVLNQFRIVVPSKVNEQKVIANILSAFDNKIALLQEQNKTLENLAQTLFKEWFGKYQIGDKLPEGWKFGKIGEMIEIKRGGSPRPIKDFISETGYRWLKISDATATPSPFIFKIKEHIKKEGLNKTVLKRAGDLVLSNSATPGMPKFIAVDTCIHDGWLHFPETRVSKEYLYLLFLSIRPNLLQQGSGSVFKNLKTDILRKFEIVIPEKSHFANFQIIVKPLFAKIYNNVDQVQKLQKARDVLLPKLMNGSVRVKGFKN